MKQTWSEILTEKFSFNLSHEIREWYDLGFYEKNLDVEFGEPVHPENFLSENSGIVWGGQMLPDTLPILENGCGDAVCIKFDKTGEVREYILWEHETGQWKPIGKQLSEVLVFNMINTNIHNDADNLDEQLQTPVIHWALRTLNFSEERKTHLKQLILEETFSCNLLDVGVARIPIYEQLVKDCLQTALLRQAEKIGGESIAKKIHVDWSTFYSWFVEPELIPPEKLHKLSRTFKMSENDFVHQDWPKAFEYAKEVLSIRKDIGWPSIIMGRYFEKKKNLEMAIDYYYKALRCAKTTYSFTADWNYNDSRLNYPSKKLCENKDILPNSILRDSYFQAARDSNYDSIFKYWQQQALENEKQEKYFEAYQCWYAAGWDSYVTDFMDIILDGLVKMAQKSDSTALYKLAMYHKSCHYR